MWEEVIRIGDSLKVTISLLKISALCASFIFEKLLRAAVETEVEHNEMRILAFIVLTFLCTKRPASYTNIGQLRVFGDKF